MVLKKISVSSPQKKPVSIPDLRPRIRPKETVRIIRRFGLIDAMEIIWQTVDCKMMLTRIRTAMVSLRRMKSSFLNSFFVSRFVIHRQQKSQTVSHFVFHWKHLSYPKHLLHLQRKHPAMKMMWNPTEHILCAAE